MVREIITSRLQELTKLEPTLFRMYSQKYRLFR